MAYKRTGEFRDTFPMSTLPYRRNRVSIPDRAMAESRDPASSACPVPLEENHQVRTLSTLSLLVVMMKSIARFAMSMVTTSMRLVSCTLETALTYHGAAGIAGGSPRYDYLQSDI